MSTVVKFLLIFKKKTSIAVEENAQERLFYPIMGGQTLKVNLRWQTNMIIQKPRLAKKQKGAQKEKKREKKNDSKKH